jgi:phage terminase large subunit-like protein
MASRREAIGREIAGLEFARDRELLVQLASIEAETKRRQTQERIRYYRPHAKQEQFHAASKAFRIRLILGGNRSGKSECSMAEVVAHATGKRDWLPKGHPDHIVTHPGTGEPLKVPSRGLVVGESFGEQVAKVLLQKLLGNSETKEGGLLPTPLVKGTKKNQQGVISEIRLTNGSVIYFKSYEQDPRLFESEQYDWYALDEPPPRRHYVAIARGATDTGAPIWMALTPLREAWIHDDLVCRPDVFTIHFDIMDNVKTSAEGTGGLTAKAVEDFEKDLTEDEKEMRLRGRFFHLQGLVYKEFSRAIHWIPRPERRWPTSWQYWMHVDPHVRKRHKAVWMAIRPDGVYNVIGELQTPPETNLISRFSEMIVDYERDFLKLRDVEIERLIDALSVQPGATGEEGLSIKDEFAKYGLYFQVGSKKRDTAIHYMHELLRARPEEGVYPKLYVVNDCAHVTYEFEHYQFTEWRGRDAGEKKDPNPSPLKKFDDYIEGIHRIVLATYQPDEDDEDEDYRHGYRISGFSTGY